MARKPGRTERSVEDIRTPVTDVVAPPPSKDPLSLPFRDRSWPDFERILLLYAEGVDGLRSVRIYGNPGQQQHGIDLYGTDLHGNTTAYQAKNVATFTASDLRAAVKKFIDEPPPFLKVQRLVICTACSTDNTQIGEELARQRDANPNLTIDLYDARTLSEGLRNRPDLVRRLFGSAWQVGFCDGAGWAVPERSTVDSLSDSLTRGPLITLGLHDDLNTAFALGDTEPGRAADLIGDIITKVAAAGFAGTTGDLKLDHARLLVEAGRISEGVLILAELAWANRTNAGIETNRRAEAELRRVALQHQDADGLLFAEALGAVDLWHRSPQPDLDSVTDLALRLVATKHLLAVEVVLWAAETAVATRQTIRFGPLVDAIERIVTGRGSLGLSDELTVRLRTAVADLGGDWTSLLRDARAGRLGPRMAALVHARFGRHCHLHGLADDAEAEFSAAVQSSCQAGLGNEAADALYSITHVRMRYGQMLEDLEGPLQMANDLRIQGHTLPLLPGRNPSDSGAEELVNGKLLPALIGYRAGLRNSVIRGDLLGEANAHKRIADILLRSGESVAAVAEIILCGDSPKEFDFATYLDLRRDVLEGAHWERASALNILALKSDLVPDDHVGEYASTALAGTSEPSQSYFGPHVSLMSWKAIASLADRLTETQAVTALDILDHFVDRDPNQYRQTDDHHIAVVARIYDSHPVLASRSAEHLTKMALQEFNLGETVRREARRSISDPTLLLDALRPHSETNDAAARIVADYSELPAGSLEQVSQRVEEVLNAPAPEKGRFDFGTDLPSLAHRARGLDQQTRDRLIEYCMCLAEDQSRPSSIRAEGMEGVLLLAKSVDEQTRGALFERTIPLALMDTPPTAVDRMLGSSNPLSPVNINLDNGALSRFALQAAARLCTNQEGAQVVQDRAVMWLTGNVKETGAVAQALNSLDPAHITIELAVLANHPSAPLRQLAALFAARVTPAAAAILQRLALDDDRGVRQNIATLLPLIANTDEPLSLELLETLKADKSWTVRKAIRLNPAPEEK